MIANLPKRKHSDSESESRETSIEMRNSFQIADG